MDISRRGATRDHGSKTILSGVPLKDEGQYWQRNVQWIPYANFVRIQTGPVKDPTGSSHHVYSISLDLEDIATIIKLLGEIASERNAEVLRNSLAEHSSSLIRLLSCSAGLIPVDLPEPKDKIEDESD